MKNRNRSKFKFIPTLNIFFTHGTLKPTPLYSIKFVYVFTVWVAYLKVVNMK